MKRMEINSEKLQLFENQEINELVTNCNQLKLKSTKDGNLKRSWEERLFPVRMQQYQNFLMMQKSKSNCELKYFARRVS